MGGTLWAIQTVHCGLPYTPPSEENINPSESSRAIPGRSHWKLCLANAEGDSPSSGGPGSSKTNLQTQRWELSLFNQSKNSNNNPAARGPFKTSCYTRGRKYELSQEKKQYLNSILSRIQKKLVQICLTSSGFRKIREKFTRGGQTYMKISQCWVRKGKLKTLQRNQHSPQGHGKSSPRNMQQYAQTTALRTTLSKDKGDEQREERV